MVPRNSINSVWSYLLCPPAILRLQKNGGQKFEVVRSQRVPSIASETNLVLPTMAYQLPRNKY